MIPVRTKTIFGEIRKLFSQSLRQDFLFAFGCFLKVITDSSILTMSLPIIKPVPDESDNVDVDDDHESGSVSSSSASGSGSGFTGHDSKTNEAETALLETFKKEEIRVRNVRIVICIAIVVMTAAVTAAIWIFAQASEYSAFQLEVSCDSFQPPLSTFRTVLTRFHSLSS